MKMFIFSGEIITSQDVFHQSITRYVYVKRGVLHAKCVIICIGHGSVCVAIASWFLVYGRYVYTLNVRVDSIISNLEKY